MLAVIMAGGGGTRLWPVSTDDNPKQFLRLGFPDSLLTQTYQRISSLCRPEEVFVTANQKYAHQLTRHLPDVPTDNFLYEPAKRDNAAAIALTLLKLIKRGHRDDIMMMLPADHYIENIDRLLYLFRQAESFIQANPEYIVTLGIQPDRPETGYGYIETTEKTLAKDIVEVKKFHEKPDQSTAEKFLHAGHFFWNSGMFIWQIGAMWSLFEKHLPDITQPLAAIKPNLDTPMEEDVLPNTYNTLPAISIDYGIMEKTDKIAVIPAENLGWNDIGNWESVKKILQTAPTKNVTVNMGTAVESKDCLLFGSDKKIYTFGLDNIGVVQTDQEVFVFPLDRASDIKNFLKQINQ